MQHQLIFFSFLQMLRYLSHSESGSTAVDGVVSTQILVAETAVSHSGTYRCEPGAAPPAQVLVHVLDGGKNL